MSGLYHFKGTLTSVGEPLDWSWSKVMTGEATWSFSDLTGDTYIWNNSSSLSFSVDDPDIVYIVMGQEVMTSIAIECMNAGKHVFIEKPITTTINEVNELIELANKNKLFIFFAISS